MVARAQAVVDEVEGLVVKYQVLLDDVVRRHASVESREHGDAGRGDDHYPPGERDAIGDGRVTTRLVLSHTILAKHDVVAASDHDAHAG